MKVFGVALLLVSEIMFVVACSALENKEVGLTFKHTAVSVDELKVPILDEHIEEVDSVSTNKAIFPLAWSLDDSYLAVGNFLPSTGSELDIYYVNDQTLTHTKGIEIGFPVYSLDWHPVQNYIAVGVTRSQGDEVRLYSFDLGTGRVSLVTTIPSSAGSIFSVRWHPFGHYLVVGKRNVTSEVHVYSFDVATESFNFVNAVGLVPVQNVSYDNLRFAPTGRNLVVGGSSHTMVLSFEPLSGRIFQAITKKSGFNRAVDWAPFNNWISVGLANSPDFLRLYTYNLLMESFTLSDDETPVETDQVFRTEWHPFGRHLLTGPINGNGTTLKLYGIEELQDLTTTRLTELQRVPLLGSLYAARWSRTGSSLAVSLSTRELKLFSMTYSSTVGAVSPVNNPIEGGIGVPGVPGVNILDAILETVGLTDLVEDSVSIVTDLIPAS